METSNPHGCAGTGKDSPARTTGTCGSKRRTVAALCCAAVCCAAVLCSACADNGTDPVPSRIDDAEQLWKNAAVTYYSVEERNTCGCPLGDRYFELTVVGDSVVRVMNPEDSSLVTGENLDLFRSVDDIFALLHSIDPADVASMSLSFDSRYGFPKDVYVDPRAGVTGDEFGYALRNFRINE